MEYPIVLHIQYSGRKGYIGKNNMHCHNFIIGKENSLPYFVDNLAIQKKRVQNLKRNVFDSTEQLM